MRGRKSGATTRTRVRCVAITSLIACSSALALPNPAAAGEVSYHLFTFDGGSVYDIGAYYQSSVNWKDTGVDDKVRARFNANGVTFEAHLMPVFPHPTSTTTDALQHCQFVFDMATCRGTDGVPISDTGLILGSGDDTGILAGPKDGEIMAGPGDDILRGGPGSDLLRGDADGDVACAGGADRVWGSGGIDTASYQEESECPSVTVTLDDQANDGVPGEGDNVHSDVEAVQGTADGGDTLIGNSGPNILSARGELRGLGGADRLHAANDYPLPGVYASMAYGGDGPDYLGSDQMGDTLDGGAGEDAFEARKGNDLIRAADGERDVVDCGDGSDTVQADAIDQLTNCENVEIT